LKNQKIQRRNAKKKLPIEVSKRSGTLFLLLLLPWLYYRLKITCFAAGTKGGEPIYYGSFIYLDIWFDLSILYLFYIDSFLIFRNNLKNQKIQRRNSKKKLQNMVK
jgi:hypothetical protein